MPNEQNPAAGKMFTLLDVFRKPNSCNDHIYHFHASESPNLIFPDLEEGGDGGKRYSLKEKLHVHFARGLDTYTL